MTKPCNRMCVVCRKMKNKSELIRFIVSGATSYQTKVLSLNAEAHTFVETDNV